MTHRVCAARKLRSFARVMRLRKSTCPAPSAPCTWNTCFAMSNPIVLTCSTDASFGGSLTPPPWHTDAVGGRPLHHPVRTSGVGTIRLVLTTWFPPYSGGQNLTLDTRLYGLFATRCGPSVAPQSELVEVVRKISLEVRHRLSVYASRSLVGLHFLEGFPHFPFRNVERLCLVHRAPPVTGWLWATAEQRSPFGPVPLQDFQP